MLASARRYVVPAAASAVMAGLLAACGSTATLPIMPGRSSHVTQLAAGSPVPYRLYTHCGIDEARIGDRYFEAVHPLSDGGGNPPRGWANPYQQGTVTLLSPTTAVFRDRTGHRVVFRLRPGATAFRHVCS
jgi:hypothetical protein